MTEITGQVLSNLDEFKQRLGHLSLLCETATFKGGTSYRLEKDLIDCLTAPTTIDDEEKSEIGRYLEKKRLCADLDTGQRTDRSRFRYADIAFRKTDETSYEIQRLTTAGFSPEIWFQDYCLAKAGVRSRTGGVTVSAKSGSKTGVSHIIDWGIELDLVSKSGRPSPIANLIAHSVQQQRHGSKSFNPYILSIEKLVHAFAYFTSDFDVFAELVTIIGMRSGQISKADAQEIYVEAVDRLASRAEKNKTLSTRQTNPIYSLWRDVEQAGKRSRKEPARTSTAWHRASSRFETLTDLGLLEKYFGITDSSYEYKYYPTQSLMNAVSTFERAPSLKDWIDLFLISTALGIETVEDVVPEAVLSQHLPNALTPLKRPTAPVPVAALALSLAMSMIKAGEKYSLNSIKKSLRCLAIDHPEKAKLSRGTLADSEGLIAINLRNIDVENGIK